MNCSPLSLCCTSLHPLHLSASPPPVFLADKIFYFSNILCADPQNLGSNDQIIFLSLNTISLTSAKTFRMLEEKSHLNQTENLSQKIENNFEKTIQHLSKTKERMQHRYSTAVVVRAKNGFTKKHPFWTTFSVKKELQTKSEKYYLMSSRRRTDPRL